jgi:hypothetical protein
VNNLSYCLLGAIFLIGALFWFGICDKLKQWVYKKSWMGRVWNGCPAEYKAQTIITTALAILGALIVAFWMTPLIENSKAELELHQKLSNGVRINFANHHREKKPLHIIFSNESDIKIENAWFAFGVILLDGKKSQVFGGESRVMPLLQKGEPLRFQSEWPATNRHLLAYAAIYRSKPIAAKTLVASKMALIPYDESTYWIVDADLKNVDQQHEKSDERQFIQNTLRHIGFPIVSETPK